MADLEAEGWISHQSDCDGGSDEDSNDSSRDHGEEMGGDGADRS